MAHEHRSKHSGGKNLCKTFPRKNIINDKHIFLCFCISKGLLRGSQAYDFLVTPHCSADIRTSDVQQLLACVVCGPSPQSKAGQTIKNPLEKHWENVVFRSLEGKYQEK